MRRKTQDDNAESESAEVYAGGRIRTSIRSHMTYCYLSILYLAAVISTSYECIILQYQGEKYA